MKTAPHFAVSESRQSYSNVAAATSIHGARFFPRPSGRPVWRAVTGQQRYSFVPGSYGGEAA